MRTFVAYVPVLHEGYRRFFETYEGPKELYIFGPEITAEFPQLAKEIRQLNAQLMKKAIETLGIFQSVTILDVEGVKALNISDKEIVLPDEDVSRELAGKYFPDAKVIFDPIFLRWDKHNALREKPVIPDEQITQDEFHQRIMRGLEKEAERSSDIWRHVAAAVVKDVKIILQRHNEHVPS